MENAVYQARWKAARRCCTNPSSWVLAFNPDVDGIK